MEWVLRVKLAQNYGRLSQILLGSEKRAIVEKSRNDRYWGAVEGADGVLRGKNQLGLMLADLRELVAIMTREELVEVEPPPVQDFLLLGKPIDIVRGAPGK